MKNHVEVFLFIDALGWELVQRTNFMSEKLPFRRKVEMQFGYSSTAIPTILSGKRPSEHGHLGFSALRLNTLRSNVSLGWSHL